MGEKEGEEEERLDGNRRCETRRGELDGYAVLLGEWDVIGPEDGALHHRNKQWDIHAFLFQFRQFNFSNDPNPFEKETYASDSNKYETPFTLCIPVIVFNDVLGRNGTLFFKVDEEAMLDLVDRFVKTEPIHTETNRADHDER